jgi:hypothetical protein
MGDRFRMPETWSIKMADSEAILAVRGLRLPLAYSRRRGSDEAADLPLD